MPLVLSLCLASAFASADPRVSLKQTGTVTSLLRALSSQSGTPLLVSENRGREVLITAFENVPLADAMKRIAWATYGRWEKANDGFRLVRDSDAEKAAERYYASWQTKEAANAIAALRDRIEKQGLAPEIDQDFASIENERRTGNRSRPIDRALAAALAQVRPETIIFNRPDAMSVYADQPTPAQNGFSTGGASILQAYNAATQQTEAPAARIVLNIDYRFGEGHAKLVLYGAAGYQVDSVHAVFHPDAQHRPTKDNELADEVPATMEVPLSEESRLIVRSVASFSLPPTPSEMDRAPEVVARMRNPEKFDPMGTFATDAWRAVAAWKGRNLVANVDDVYLFPYWAQRVPKLREAFRAAGGYNAEVQPGWVVARPSLPTPPWLHRIDRSELGRLARAEFTSDFGMLMDRSRFAGAMSVMPDAWTMKMYLAFAKAPAPLYDNGWLLPRVLGTMTEDQRQDWVGGKTVPIANLPVAARMALRQAVASSNESNILIQPTIQFPNGLPDQGTLRAEVNPFSGYSVRWKDQEGNQPGYVLEDVMPQFMRYYENKGPVWLEGLSVRRFEGPSLRLVADMGPLGSLDLGMYFEKGATRGGFVPWMSLPEETRRRLSKGPYG